MSTPLKCPLVTRTPLVRSASLDSQNSVDCICPPIPLVRQTTLQQQHNQAWRVELGVVSERKPRVISVEQVKPDRTSFAGLMSPFMSKPVPESEYVWNITVCCSAEIQPMILAINQTFSKTPPNSVESPHSETQPETRDTPSSSDLTEIKNQANLQHQMEHLSIEAPPLDDDWISPPQNKWAKPPPPTKEWSASEIEYEKQRMDTSGSIWTPSEFDAIIRSDQSTHIGDVTVAINE